MTKVITAQEFASLKKEAIQTIFLKQRSRSCMSQMINEHRNCDNYDHILLMSDGRVATASPTEELTANMFRPRFDYEPKAQTFTITEPGSSSPKDWPWA